MVSAGRELRREQSHSALLRSERGWRAAAAPASDFRKRHLKALAGVFGQVLGPMFAAEIRKRRVAHMRGYPQWRWHLDEAFVKVNGKLCYLWRAVDHEGEVCFGVQN